MNANNTSFSTVPTDVSRTSASLKIALLLLTGVSAHFSLTPPHSAALKTVITRASLFERSVTWFTFCSKTLVWIMTLSDAIITYLEAYYPGATSSLYDGAEFTFDGSPAIVYQAANPLLAPSAMMFAGSFAVAFGSLLRQWCFRKLGSLFTFEITIQPDHALITTGPYGIVRHPSYTGIYLTLLGSTAVAFAPGAYLRECWLGEAFALGEWGRDGGLSALLLVGAVQVSVAALVALWFVTSAYAMRSTIKRLNFEDQELHRVFGKAWEAWAERVQWKLAPGIY